MFPIGLPQPAFRPAVMLLVVAGLIVLTAGVYRGVSEFAFVNFDDDVHVYANPFVTTGLSAQNARWALEIHGPSQWHPLAWLSHQLDCEVFGLWPGGHHLTSVGLHVANVVLLFVWLTGLTQSIWRSAFTAAVFAVHPLNVESVAWVSERRNVLCLFFCLLTLIVYVSYVRRSGRWRYGGVLILFALALMSKPLAVTLPCVLLLLDFWPLNRCERTAGQRPASPPAGAGDGSQPRQVITIRFLILEKVPLLLLAAGASVLTMLCQQGVVVSDGVLPVGVRILNTFAAYALYLKRVCWPSDLGVLYPHPGFVSSTPIAELIAPAVVGLVLVAGLSGMAVWRIGRHPQLAVGWFWFLGTLVPMIGLVQVGGQQLADRYVYLSLIGLLMAIAWTIPAVRTSSWQFSIAALAVAAIGLLALTARRQLGTWRNSVSLFEQAVLVTQENPWAENNLGLALHQRGESAAAIAHLLRAVQIDPDYGLARYNLGVVLHDLGRTELAIVQFEQAVQLMPRNVQSHLRLGIARADTGDLSAASAQFERALQLAPGNSDAHFNLGLVLSRQGLHRRAIEQYRQALEERPANAKARYGLAEALRAVEQYAESERHFQLLLQQPPFAALAHQGLGQIYLKQHERLRALEQFREALRLDPSLGESRALLRREAAP